MSRIATVGHHLAWKTTRVDGRAAVYGEAGHGTPVLFLHGWALGCHAYKRALKRLAGLGCHVYAPALPEFGGTEGLPSGYRSLGDYAGWADAFLTAVGVDEPALVAGHSLGGGVAARLAHDFPDRVARLVLINSLGSSVWTETPTRTRSLSERPLWHWATSFSQDIAMSKAALATLRAVAEDCVPNLLRNPIGLVRAGAMARTVDLAAELVRVRQSGVPATVVTSSGDLIVTEAAFRDLCRVLGVQGKVVPGRHSWLLSAPDEFAAVMLPVVGAATAARSARVGVEGRVLSLFDQPTLAASG